MLRRCLFMIACVCAVLGRPNSLPDYTDGADDLMHSYVSKRSGVLKNPHHNVAEETAKYWNKQAQLTLTKKLKRRPITGDGMSIATSVAARTYLGQSINKPGEETELSFERFPYTGLSKTYCVNAKVADSACTATAYLCGVKANEGTIGVTAAVPLGNCSAMQNKDNHVYSIGRWSQLKGKRTGIVTTTSVTNASPAGVYAHTAHRRWETDTEVTAQGCNPNECKDIANQLIHGITGKNLNVILGGGRCKFLPENQIDEEGHQGKRGDEKNLIEKWKKKKKGFSHQYVWNRTGLLGVPSDTEYLLGLFDKDHTSYNVDRDPRKKPSLTEMTQIAILLLSQGKNGYFLFVEGGRIDHAHHASKAHKALNETTEFHKAVQAAVDSTDESDTLIVVTSDHSHTMTLNGYPDRRHDVLRFGGVASDKLPYTTLSYANGPGYRKETNGQRHEIRKDDLSNPEYIYPALVPRKAESHAGEDVGIYAVGPWAHLFTGVVEQNIIPHIMAYASCVGNGQTVCSQPSAAKYIKAHRSGPVLIFTVVLRYSINCFFQ